MDIDVLGPLVAREGGTSVVPTAAKPRKVLAMLTVHADQVVPMASLFEELWGGGHPAQREHHRADLHPAPA